MTLVTDVLDRIARQTSTEIPTSWISATEDEHVEIRDDLMRETIDDVLERVDLPSPIGKQYTITGDGSQSYSLPSDFLRLQRDDKAVYETTTINRGLIPISTDGGWTQLLDFGTSGSCRYYKIEGYAGNWTMSIYREPSASISIVVSYIANLWMADNGGIAGNAFTSATDLLLIPRRVVETGTVARWRERNGITPDDKYREYERELSRMINDRRSIRKIKFGGPTYLRSPFDIPVPDEIPTS